MTESRLQFAMRLGVVACVAVVVATTALKLEDALGIFDLRADTNAALTYSQRAHTHPEWSAENGRVLETARLWMPEDARYRIVYGPKFDPEASSDFTHLLLRSFLLPRRPTAADTAAWVFCYDCRPATLERIDVLARVGDGLVFGRMRP